MKNKFLIFSVCSLVLLVAAGAYFWKNDKPSDSRQSGVETADVPKNEKESLAASGPSGFPDAKDFDSNTGIPSQSDIRTQMLEDAHDTPPAMIEYAEKIGVKMEAATESPEKAEQLFLELTECALGTVKTVTSIQALCLSDAE